MSHMLPHLSQNTSTRSLSLIFRPSSPSLSCPSELDRETLRDSRRSGGKTKSASPTGYEPKLIQSDDFEPQRIELDRHLGKDLQPRRIELDRNIGTDPYQILERILGDDYQNPITEDMEETGNFGDDMPYVQSRIHSDYDAAETIAHSDLEDGELRKMLASPLYVHGRGEKLWLFSKTHSFRETRSKNNTDKCTTYSSWSLWKRELEIKFISRATSVWETRCIIFIKERRIGEPVRKFYVQTCWSVKIGKISSWR